MLVRTVGDRPVVSRCLDSYSRTSQRVQLENNLYFIFIEG